MNLKSRISRAALCGLAGALFLSGASYAMSHGGGHDHSEHTGIYKERSDAMKAMAGAAKSTGAMLKGEAPYDEAQIKANAAKVQGIAGDPLLALFPEGTNAAPSEALDKVWEDWEGFAAASALLKQRADAFAAAGTKQEVGAAFGAMLQACGGCHKAYRVDKDK